MALSSMDGLGRLTTKMLSIHFSVTISIIRTRAKIYLMLLLKDLSRSLTIRYLREPVLEIFISQSDLKARALISRSRMRSDLTLV